MSLQQLSRVLIKGGEINVLAMRLDTTPYAAFSERRRANRTREKILVTLRIAPVAARNSSKSHGDELGSQEQIDSVIELIENSRDGGLGFAITQYGAINA